MKKTYTKGFTLIELLIVVAIIGILASIVLVGLRGGQESARDARRLSELRQFQSLLELDKAQSDTGGYSRNAGPANIAPTVQSILTQAQGLRDPLSVTGVPPWPDYQYLPSLDLNSSPDGQGYMLFAALEGTTLPAGTTVVSLDMTNGSGNQYDLSAADPNFIGCGQNGFTDSNGNAHAVFCIKI